MKPIKLLFATSISFVGLVGMTSVSHAGYTCSSTSSGTTFCSGSINGVSVNATSNTTSSGTTFTHGSIGGESFSQTCSTASSGITFCN